MRKSCIHENILPWIYYQWNIFCQIISKLWYFHMHSNMLIICWSYADHMLIICWCFFVRLDKYCLTRILFTLLLSPPLLFLYYSILYVYMFEGHAELPTIISESIDLTTGGLTELYLSSQVLGSWVYVTVSTCVWPLWLAIWSINFQ